MKIRKLTTQMFFACLILTLTSLIIGCGSSGGDDDNDNNTNNNSSNDNTNNLDNDNDVVNNEFTGTWLIEKEDTVSFWIFNEDGTFEKKRAGEPINGARHFVGTYSVEGGFLTGDFTNPGVGRGEIEGTINENGIFLMDFIEYWHNPRKVVPCTGVKQ